MNECVYSTLLRACPHRFGKRGNNSGQLVPGRDCSEIHVHVHWATWRYYEVELHIFLHHSKLLVESTTTLTKQSPQNSASLV